MISGKIWGNTELIYKNDNFEVHRIFIRKKGYCSLHAHNFKHNLFFVEKGKLKIKVYKNDYKLCDETILNDGDKTSINPKEYHQFEALEDTHALEIYFPEPITNDIVRKNCGGMLK